MKKKLSVIVSIILLLIFTISFKVYAAGVDLSQCVKENLETTFRTENITNYDLTKYNKANDKRINIYVFRKNGCQNCKNFYEFYVANKLLNSHGDKIKIITYEVTTNPENSRLLSAAKTLLNQQSSTYSTPIIFIGNKTFEGDLVTIQDAAQKQAEIEAAIDSLYNSSNRYDIIEELFGKNIFTDNSANITLTSNERLDKNYTLKVREVDNRNLKLEDGYEYIISYDISMYNGSNVVPLSNGSYKIKIPVNVKYNTYKVGYVKDGKIQEDFKATYNNGNIEFTTSHLSEYLIYGTNSTSSSTDANQNTNLETDKDKTKKDSIKKTVKTKYVENEKNPKTFDAINVYIVLLIIGCSTLIGSFILSKKKRI